MVRNAGGDVRGDVGEGMKRCAEGNAGRDVRGDVGGDMKWCAEGCGERWATVASGVPQKKPDMASLH